MIATPEEIGTQMADDIMDSDSDIWERIALDVCSVIRAERSIAVKSLKEWMTEQGFSTGTGDTMSDLLSELD